MCEIWITKLSLITHLIPKTVIVCLLMSCKCTRVEAPWLKSMLTCCWIYEPFSSLCAAFKFATCFLGGLSVEVLFSFSMQLKVLNHIRVFKRNTNCYRQFLKYEIFNSFETDDTIHWKMIPVRCSFMSI